MEEAKRNTRKKDKAPRGVFQPRKGLWAVRFTCAAGHVHEETIGPIKGDAVNAYHDRRQRTLAEPGWCPRSSGSRPGHRQRARLARSYRARVRRPLAQGARGHRLQASDAGALRLGV